ncbi:MAG: elongation factor P maturation arginine rhamnosyltransferase EarP [Hahellaceae bacterium]|nr:elongation factor P maturation arginine rhamnosyltransferase EarP [Hahellaceae bacterium]
MRAIWDIFCHVVDNFGDIGVTWRLAQQLASEYDFDVHLWVSDMSAFRRICPQAETASSLPLTQQGVKVYHWTDDNIPVRAADVVIEAFACQLPKPYIALMAQKSPAPLWLNLEYLSAEDWVEGCHGLPSPQPDKLEKYFFFPGFTAQTGGLIREHNLICRRQQFQQSPHAINTFLHQLGVSPAPDAMLISLFAYENKALASWLDSLASASRPTHVLVPEGRILADVANWLEVPALATGDHFSRGALDIQVLPFISQSDYDRLLWSCDFNAVRGEDSFVRAQWAGRPFIWHIYQQENDTHLEKLDAFLHRYTQGLPAEVAEPLRALWQAWNSEGNMGENWHTLLAQWPHLISHAEEWCGKQQKVTNLAKSLAQFYQIRV